MGAGPSKRSAQVFARRRSCTRRCKSTSAVTIPVVKGWLSASIAPFSAIKSCPAKTRSVEDSPSPASA